jgi:hypothetical protein
MPTSNPWTQNVSAGQPANLFSNASGFFGFGSYAYNPDDNDAESFVAFAGDDELSGYDYEEFPQFM